MSGQTATRSPPVHIKKLRNENFISLYLQTSSNLYKLSLQQRCDSDPGRRFSSYLISTMELLFGVSELESSSVYDCTETFSLHIWVRSIKYEDIHATPVLKVVLEENHNR